MPGEPRSRRSTKKAPKAKTQQAARPLSRSSAGKVGFEKVFERIYKLVLRIPPGRVMTYGQIARILEDRYSPRLVGWAMHATPHDERNIPWHRVINSRGSISTDRVIPYAQGLQRSLLEAEGVVFNDRGSCDLSDYQWSPRSGKFKAITVKRSRPRRAKEAQQPSSKGGAARRTAKRAKRMHD